MFDCAANSRPCRLAKYRRLRLKSEWMWRIDTSQAPRDHPDLPGTIQDIQDKLANPEFVRSISVHESAHAFYWGLEGRATIHDYTVRLLGDDLGHCSVEYAATILVDPTERKQCSGLGLAKAHVAGSAACEVLTPGYEPGDSKDFENFKTDILAYTKASLADLEDAWQTARTEIKAELQVPNSPIRIEINRLADIFERRYRLVSQIR